MARNRPSGKVRIIGGQWRRRWLPVADVDGLRPTTDRVRETLFNWLGAKCHGARVLDLFAGSGALGFEAMSRGARSLTLIDQDRQVTRTLAEVVSLLEAQRVEVITADARRWLQAQPAKPFDIVFIDPPFRDADAAHLCTLLLEFGWLTPAAVLYVEQPADRPSELPQPLTVIKEKTAGQVRYGLHTVLRETPNE
ncbi:MAG: 16S rRNA (guanine(966)-N(2))-methyltransferase RsmD [Pseudomonadota bacterium]